MRTAQEVKIATKTREMIWAIFIKRDAMIVDSQTTQLRIVINNLNKFIRDEQGK